LIKFAACLEPNLKAKAVKFSFANEQAGRYPAAISQKPFLNALRNLS